MVDVGPNETTVQSTRIDSERSPRERFIRACGEAITSGDVRLAKLAHAAVGALLDDGATGNAVIDLLVERARRQEGP
jgi:hypothetical protein